MVYILKHKDIPVLKFEVLKNIYRPVVQILWVTEDNHLLPLDLTLSNAGLSHWFCTRIIQRNRAYADGMLYRCGLSMNRPIDILFASKGLTLNDVYWITTERFKGLFKDFNLYTNHFNNDVALIALTGSGFAIDSSFISSPEFTTRGILPKCWRRVNGKIMLYKGSMNGLEPYSEYYASQIAKAVGINAIEYRISKWKNVLCSTCEIFTSEKYSFISAGKLVKSNDIQDVRRLYETLGDRFVKELDEMLIFDMIINNTDRHFGNFGVLVDNETNTIVKPAPLFDHGNSLFSQCQDHELLDSFLDFSRILCRDFFRLDESVIERNKPLITRLLTYSMKKNPRYNVSDRRLQFMETQIQNRARLLLEEKLK